MHLTARTEYACLAVLDLATHHQEEEPVQIRRIAAAHGIPARFLVQILLQLKGAGLVSSTRGAAGGYRLARDPHEITLWDVIRVIDGNDLVVSSHDTSPGSAREVLLETWQDLCEAQRRRLQSTTFGDLAARVQDTAAGMYYI